MAPLFTTNTDHWTQSQQKVSWQMLSGIVVTSSRWRHAGDNENAITGVKVIRGTSNVLLEDSRRGSTIAFLHAISILNLCSPKARSTLWQLCSGEFTRAFTRGGPVYVFSRSDLLWCLFVYLFSSLSRLLGGTDGFTAGRTQWEIGSLILAAMCQPSYGDSGS